jgi:hypothetical protein
VSTPTLRLAQDRDAGGAGPLLLARQRLDAAEIVAWDPDDFAKQMAGPPALHRYPGSMAVRIKAVWRLPVGRLRRRRRRAVARGRLA